MARSRTGVLAVTTRCSGWLSYGPEEKETTARRETLGGFGVRLVSRDGRWKMVEAVRIALTSSRSQAECLKLLGYAPKKMGAGVGVAPTSPELMRLGGTTGSTRGGHDGGNCTREPRLCRPVP